MTGWHELLEVARRYGMVGARAHETKSVIIMLLFLYPHQHHHDVPFFNSSARLGLFRTKVDSLDSRQGI